MAINWNFNASDYEETSFVPIPIGNHRCRIAEIEETKSKSGNDMLKITLDVSGQNGTLWYYLVFMPDNTKMTNQKLGELWESFGIKQGDMNFKSWVGKVGACRVKHETYEGEEQARLHYFIKREKQTDLPTWKEPDRNKGMASESENPFEDPDLGEPINDIADLL